MYGAILGDMIGAPYEFDMGNKSKEFPLFCKQSQFTDDSVMTIAVAEALMDSMGESEEQVKEKLIISMQKWGRKYPYAGYGGMFYHWLKKKNPKPYGSYGNGSAMRVSSAGWLFDTMDGTRKYARLSAEVTHNHPEGIKGAEATASAIFLARNGASKDEIKEYLINEFHYDLSRTCDEIRPGYHHVESCQETVPEAITAFLEGTDFEDVIRTAVSLGGDCDTLTCIAGGIAEAFYGVPEELKKECRKRLRKDMLEILDRFEEQLTPPFHDSFLDGNEIIEEAIEQYYTDNTNDNLKEVLETIRKRNFIDTSMRFFLGSEAAGLIINPWGRYFLLEKDLIEEIFDADGSVEYAVPDDPITSELLEDGSFLKRAAAICSRNQTPLNMIKLARILRDSYVWIPCNTVLSDADYEACEKTVMEAKEKNDLDSLIGMKFTNQDEVRLLPDILQSGEEYFFPVFTTAEEMGEYGEIFSKVEGHFLEAINLAKNNEKNVSGIVINAFSEPFVVSMEMIEIIADMESGIPGEEDKSDE